MKKKIISLLMALPLVSFASTYQYIPLTEKEFLTPKKISATTIQGCFIDTGPEMFSIQNIYFVNKTSDGAVLHYYKGQGTEKMKVPAHMVEEILTEYQLRINICNGIVPLR